eukprot:ANDGO_05512.mRNA.1 hypothetical protein
MSFRVDMDRAASSLSVSSTSTTSAIPMLHLQDVLTADVRRRPSTFSASSPKSMTPKSAKSAVSPGNRTNRFNTSVASVVSPLNALVASAAVPRRQLEVQPLNMKALRNEMTPRDTNSNTTSVRDQRIEAVMQPFESAKATATSRSPVHASMPPQSPAVSTLTHRANSRLSMFLTTADAALEAAAVTTRHSSKLSPRTTPRVLAAKDGKPASSVDYAGGSSQFGFDQTLLDINRLLETHKMVVSGVSAAAIAAAEAAAKEKSQAKQRPSSATQRSRSKSADLFDEDDSDSARPRAKKREEIVKEVQENLNKALADEPYRKEVLRKAAEAKAAKQRERTAFLERTSSMKKLVAEQLGMPTDEESFNKIEWNKKAVAVKPEERRSHFFEAERRRSAQFQAQRMERSVQLSENLKEKFQKFEHSEAEVRQRAADKLRMMALLRFPSGPASSRYPNKSEMTFIARIEKELADYDEYLRSHPRVEYRPPLSKSSSIAQLQTVHIAQDSDGSDVEQLDVGEIVVEQRVQEADASLSAAPEPPASAASEAPLPAVNELETAPQPDAEANHVDGTDPEAESSPKAQESLSSKPDGGKHRPASAKRPSSAQKEVVSHVLDLDLKRSLVRKFRIVVP